MKADEVISQVADLCRKYNAKEVILYGSRAKGTADSVFCGPCKSLDALAEARKRVFSG